MLFLLSCGASPGPPLTNHPPTCRRGHTTSAQIGVIFAAELRMVTKPKLVSVLATDRAFVEESGAVVAVQ